MSDRTIIREVKLENAELTVHIPTEYDNIHEAIEEALGARYIKGYDIAQTYEIDEY